MRFAVLFALLGTGPAAACPGLEATDPWIRATPGAAMAAGFATLANRGPKTLVVDGAASPAFGGVALHRTVVRDGMYRMESGALEVPVGATRALEPGGWHLMLSRPTRPLQAGERLPVRLECGTESREFVFVVKGVES